MKIVALDAHCINPDGDLDWAPLRALGDVTIYPRTKPEELVGRLQGANIALTNKVRLIVSSIEQLPELRYVGVTATGYDCVDVAAARKHNITVTNVPEYSTASVAQTTIALLLELSNHVAAHARTVQEGQWSKCPDFCYWVTPLTELSGLTMGIVGYGRIGQAVANITRSLGMKIIASGRSQKPGVEIVPLDELFARSDAISLHCPLTPETKQLVNAARLKLMKPSAFLLNTGRGPLIDEAALADALNAGRIAGAGLDVLSTEPPPPTNPLFAAKNCLITPHIGWASRASRQRLLDITVQNLQAFVAGKPLNVVN